MTSADNERHKKKMQRQKEKVDAAIARATEDRGVVVVMTGNGKGKSSSGFGTVIRALGHGYGAGVAQFIKGEWDTGECQFIRRHCPEVPVHTMQTGFTWETQDRELDQRAAEAVWVEAEKMLADESLRLVLLDELTYMLAFNYLDAERVYTAIRNRPQQQSVVITGRGAPTALRELADTVSDIHADKHAFAAGIKAQQGVEW